jgi:hypothetical protein
MDGRSLEVRRQRVRNVCTGSGDETRGQRNRRHERHFRSTMSQPIMFCVRTVSKVPFDLLPPFASAKQYIEMIPEMYQIAPS